MATEWYVERNGEKRGPMSGSKLKKLATAGKIRPDDLVFKGHEGKARSASAIPGLFNDDHAMSTAKPSNDGPEPNHTSEPDAIENRPQAESGIVSRARESAKDIAALTAKQARLKKLQFVDLASADHAIGVRALELRIDEDTFGDRYEEIAQIDDRISELQEVKQPDSPETISDRLKRAGQKTATLARIEKLASQRKKLVSNLGTSVRADAASQQDDNLRNSIGHAANLQNEIHQLNDEIQNLGQKKSLFGKTRTVALSVGAVGVIVLLAWGMNSFFGGNAAEERIATVNGMLADSLSSIEDEHQELARKSQEIARQLETERLEASKREELLAAQREVELKQARLERERANRAMLEEQAQQEAERMRESTLQEEEEQANRQDFAQRLFTGFSLDPNTNVTLSDSLKQSGATVELRGRKYTTLQSLQQSKNWLGMVNFFAEGRYPRYNAFPAVSTIQRSFQQGCNDLEMRLLVKTNREFEPYAYQFPNLCLVTFSLSVDQTYSYTSSLDVERITDRHPDGIGYLHRWSPLDGLSIVFVAKNRSDIEHVGDLRRALAEFHDTLYEKERLGEIDEKTRKVRFLAELSRVYNDVLIWARKH